jgi:ABC-type nitrate/sulfonate/bicarbonate transport system substrate-binding protein
MILFFVLSHAGQMAAQGKAEKDKIRIGYAARAVTHSLPFLTQEAGFFRDEGLQVEVVRTAGAVSPMALISGDTDFATMSAYLMIPVAARRVAATMVSPPATLFARKAGMNFLVNLAELKIEYQGSTFVTRRSVMKSSPNLVFRTVRALVRGVHYFKTRREDTYRILGKFLGTKDREALEESWRYGADMPAKPYAGDSAVQAVIQHLAEGDPKFGKYKPADFIDSGPLTELDRSGYIDRLYGGQAK